MESKLRYIKTVNDDDKAAKKLRASIDKSLEEDKAKHEAALERAAGLRGSHSPADLRRGWGSPAEVWTAHMPEHIVDGGYTQLKMESMADALERIRAHHRHRAHARARSDTTTTSSSSSESGEASCSESLSQSGSSSSSTTQ